MLLTNAFLAERREADKLQATKERKEIIEWISPLNFTRVQEETLKKREAGTAEWLLKSTQFTCWVETRGQTLHCEGIRKSASSLVIQSMQANHSIAGSGKTVFTSVISLLCSLALEA